MRFTDVRYVGWKKIGWAVFEKNSFFHFWGLLKIFWGLQNLIWHQKPHLAQKSSLAVKHAHCTEKKSVSIHEVTTAAVSHSEVDNHADNMCVKCFNARQEAELLTVNVK